MAACVMMTDGESLAIGDVAGYNGGFGGTVDGCTASGTVKAEGNEPVVCADMPAPTPIRIF